MRLEEKQLSQLVDMENPQRVMDEVKTIVFMMFPEFDFEAVNSVFRDVVSLFRGQYPGYRKCNTAFHDLRHSTDTMLDMSRLIHGAMVNRQDFSEKNVALGLITALFHDTGFIQTIDDNVGTGSKYTLTHISRSIEFMDKYFTEKGYSREDVEYCSAILKCTGLGVKMNDIHFLSLENEMLGKMLGTADLLSQMADRIYLEKLLFLYREFKEGNVEGFESELDLLKKTPGFFNMSLERFEHDLGGVNKYMRDHFRVRWGIDKDLDITTIENNIKYLNYVLENHQDDYRKHLRRGVLPKKLDEIRGEAGS